VNQLRNQLLARAGFAGNEHIAIGKGWRAKRAYPASYRPASHHRSGFPQPLLWDRWEHASNRSSKRIQIEGVGEIAFAPALKAAMAKAAEPSALMTNGSGTWRLYALRVEASKNAQQASHAQNQQLQLTKQNKRRHP
jgi:hypothetical protein